MIVEITIDRSYTSVSGGDMESSVYDPNTVENDAFDMDNMIAGTTNDILTTGTQNIQGVKTFVSFPVTPSSSPTTDYQVANKKYVDDNAGGQSAGLIESFSTTLDFDQESIYSDVYDQISDLTFEIGTSTWLRGAFISRLIRTNGTNSISYGDDIIQGNITDYTGQAGDFEFLFYLRADGLVTVNTIETEFQDVDALAIITQIELTASLTGSQKSAINSFFKDMKGTGTTSNGTNFYSKIAALHMFVVNDQDACKWNWVNPVDSDAGFRLTYSGGLTFSSGVTGNGTTGYINCHVNTSTVLAGVNDAGFTIAKRVDSASTGRRLGAKDSSDFVCTDAGVGYIGSLNGASASGGDGNYIGTTTWNRISSTDFQAFTKNNAGVITGTPQTTLNAAVSLPNLDMLYLCLNNGGAPVLYNADTFTHFSLHDGLTDNEANDYIEAIHTLLTAFSLNV